MIMFRSPLAHVNYWRKLGNTCPKPGIYSCRIPQPTSHRVRQREQSVPGWMMVAFGAKRTLFGIGARWLGRE
jgi:hypothetical protein